MNGLYVAPPHGKLVYRGMKTAIAKDRPWRDLQGEFVLVSDGCKNGRAYGTITTVQEGPFNAHEFKSRFNDHRVTDKEQARWWPDGDKFYLYTIASFKAFAVPLPVEVPAGVQTLMGDVIFKEANMPWKVFKVDDEFCVYKVNDDGERTGDSLGCHPKESDARSQQAALYASESKTADVPNLVETKCGPQGDFVPFGVTSFQEMDDIEAIRAEQAEKDKRRMQFHQIADNVIEDPAVVDKEAALTQIAGEYVDRVSGSRAKELFTKAGRRLNASMLGLLDQAKDILEKLRTWAGYDDDEKSLPFSIKIVGDHFVTLTTNAFIDREGEIFATDAIEKFVERHKSDSTKGEVWYRHLKGSKFAHTIFQGMQGRFLIEVHAFDDTPIGQAMKALLNEHPAGHPEVAPEGWGCSHGFYYDPEDRKDAIYEWFEKRETSVLPNSVASNPYTKLEVVPMDQKAREEFETLVGKDLAASVLTVSDELTKQLEGTVAFKEAAEPDPETVEEVAEEAETESVEEAEVAEAVEEVAEEAETEVGADETEVDDKAIEAFKQAIDFDGLVSGFKTVTDEVKQLREENDTLKVELTDAKERLETVELNKEADAPRWPWSQHVPSQDKKNVAQEGDEVLNHIPPKANETITNLVKSMVQ